MPVEASSILIVDDEEINSEGLARRLQRHGYAVTVAKSGRQALERLGERRFDLVLLDIMMPGMNGLEVLKFLRRVDSLIELPIIMVTAKGESEDMVEPGGTGTFTARQAFRLQPSSRLSLPRTPLEMENAVPSLAADMSVGMPE